MRGQDIYRGAAPEAMARMGEGIAQGYANVGRIYGEGYKAMGEGIAQGISSLGSSIGKMQQQNKLQKADYDASVKIYDSPSFREAMGLSKQQAEDEKAILKQLLDDGGYKAANAYAKQQFDSLISYAAASRAFEMNKELQSSRIAQQGDVDLNKIGAAAMLDAYGKTPVVPLGSTSETSATRPFTTPIKFDLTTGQTGFK